MGSSLGIGSGFLSSGAGTYNPRTGLRASLAVVTAVMLIAGLGFAYLKSIDRADAYSADQAVAAFRTPPPTQPAPSAEAPAPTAPGEPAAPAGDANAAPAAPAAPAGGAVAAAAAPQAPIATVPSPLTRPAEGVYVYKTSGGESTTVLGGAKHEYPEQTTITVRHTPCGVDTSWRPLEQRADYRSFCTDEGGLRAVVLASQRQFFGRTAGSFQECGPTTYYLRFEGPAPAASWSGPCKGRASGLEVTLTGTLLGREMKQVGSQTIDAIRFQINVESVGESHHTKIKAIVTMAAATGLYLALDSTTEATGSSQGTSGTYNEHYTLELTDLNPLT